MNLKTGFECLALRWSCKNLQPHLGVRRTYVKFSLLCQGNKKKPDKIQVLLTPILRQALLATITIVRRFAQYELSDYESWPQSQIYTSDILFWWFQLFLLDLHQTIFCFYNMDKPHAFPASIFASRKRPAKGKVKLTIMISLSFALVPWPNPNVAMIYYIEHAFFYQSVVTLRKLWRRIIFSLSGGAGGLFKSFSAHSFIDLFFLRSGCSFSISR